MYMYMSIYNMRNVQPYKSQHIPDPFMIIYVQSTGVIYVLRLLLAPATGMCDSRRWSDLVLGRYM